MQQPLTVRLAIAEAAMPIFFLYIYDNETISEVKIQFLSTKVNDNESASTAGVRGRFSFRFKYDFKTQICCFDL